MIDKYDPSQAPDPEEKRKWNRLLTVTEEVKELEPWKWMHEEQVFGVQFPGGEEIGFISIMGEFGEHYAITTYLGKKALLDLNKLYKSHDEENAPERLFEIRQLMLSFEDREYLEETDRKIIKDLGFKFRGRDTWPFFRSFCPGYSPWHLVDEEIEKLAIALEQTLDVSVRCRENPDIVVFDNPASFLIRTPQETETGVEWVDEVKTLTPREPERLDFEMDRRPLFSLANTEKADKVLDVDLFLAPGAIGGKDERPQSVYLLLAMDPESQLIIGTETLQALDGINPMLGKVPAAVVELLMNAGYVPAEIRVQSERLFELLKWVCDEVDIELTIHKRLPLMNAMKKEMSEFLVK